jgi:RNA polymerase sigma-70 factor (ECF subfamily)
VTVLRPAADVEGAPRGGDEPPPNIAPAIPVVPGFRELYDSEFVYVWNTLRRLGVAPQDLEDAAHEVFVCVFRKLASYDANRPLRSWIFGVTYRTVLELRKRRRRTESELAQDVEDPARRVDEQLEGREERELVLQGLQSIREDRRVVFVMFELDGHSMPEIASTLGLPLNTAYSRLRLARDEFASAVRFLRLKRGER